MGGNTSSSTQENEFGKFMLSEYANIAKAHFKTIDTISEFFKQYLTIVSIPITVLVVIINLPSVKNAASTVVGDALPLLALLFSIISVVGLMVLWHVLNLRLDALLYARTINGIRKYFYDHEDRLDIETKSRLRVLPQSPLLPVYREFRFFGPVVLAFALLNSLYCYFACAAWAHILAKPQPFMDPIVMVFTSVFFTAHIGLYLYLAQYREFGYLRANSFGVDIDGVLNQQREQFCRFLEANAGKKMDPDAISSIPVHDCPGLGITREDERTVFNDPVYWIGMPPMNEAADNLRRLRNSQKLKIHIFTHRPWPIATGLSEKTSHKKWTDESKAYAIRIHQGWSLWKRLFSWARSIRRELPYRILRVRNLIRREAPIDLITKVWLEEHGFEYDGIMIEKGSEDVADPGGHIHNRFYACRMVPIRYFVEDDLIKAKKLAYICDAVFLMDQPYNKSSELPANVIRVKTWKEIRDHMRELW